MHHDSWRPSASIDTLKKRAELLTSIRSYFSSTRCLEVTTPILSHATVTDPHLASLSSISHANTLRQQHYLQTSPEYYMKRLLSAGSGDIFQICPAFRDDEMGKRHQIEFTILEWYRLDHDHHQLIDDVAALLKQIAGIETFQKISYSDLFERYCQLSPLSCSLSEALTTLERFNINLHNASSMSLDACLDCLMSIVIEPHLGMTEPIFVVDYPNSQSALARRNQDGLTAGRFELYFRGLEIANGFYELADANEQRERFEADNQKRVSMGLPTVSIDQKLLAALEHGLPRCSGVALGVDRLLMAIMQTNNIADVVSFTVDVDDSFLNHADSI